MNTKSDLGLPSAIKDSTYQQNREKEQLIKEVNQAEQEVSALERLVEKLKGD
jgi:hypothetical protein